jgi:hypothetical protein
MTVFSTMEKLRSIVVDLIAWSVITAQTECGSRNVERHGSIAAANALFALPVLMVFRMVTKLELTVEEHVEVASSFVAMDF